MWQYVFRLVRRQPGKSMLASSGFLLAACALVLLSATTQTTVVQANQIISQNWRSTYDLVVLSPQAKITSKNTIPDDLMEGYDGGISLQQYQQIEKLPGVEVAAPIAYIGYVQMPIPELQFFKQPLPTGFYRINLTVTAFNGERQLTEHTLTQIYYHLASCDPPQPSTAEIDAWDSKGIYFECGIDSTFFYGLTPPIDTGTFLLAAIDPTAEDQLVHLDKNITSGRMLTPQDTIHVNKNPSLDRAFDCPNGDYTDLSKCRQIPNLDLPVLFHTQLPGQATMKGQFTIVSTGTLTPQTVVNRGGLTYLTHLPTQQTLFDGVVPIVQNDPQRFSVSDLALNGNSWQPYTPIYGLDPYTASLRFLYAPSSLSYQPATSPDGSSAYSLVPDGVQGPEVTFRALNSLHIAEITRSKGTFALPKAFYFFNPVGQFTGGTLAAQFSNPLNWLPENTYTSPPTTLRYDAQGNPITPTNLLPTTNTAGFILQPPLALTTLDAAVKLRGDHVISAIRIRVSGVDAANSASWQRVQQVAALIHERTNLQVLVTLGSSPRPTLVYVPGVSKGQLGATQNVAPVGWVEERWITIGASI
ncbi:MAG TPA: hypothetical protein VKR83_12170, partial [Ktedonobacteraceae bacterium]|nr:hypothetical protein [Ktedonobacteraceae bacterium]